MQTATLDGTKTRQLNLEEYPGQPFQRALALLSITEEWIEEKPAVVVPVAVDRIVTYTYKEDRLVRYLADLDHKRPLPVVDLTRYVLPGAMYFVPHTEWHGVEAAKLRHLETVQGLVKSTHHIAPDRFFMDGHGLWWVTRDPVVAKLVENRAGIQAEREILKALGVVEVKRRATDDLPHY